MRKFAVVDAETDPFDGITIPEPFLWGFYDGDLYRQFERIQDLIRFLDDKPLIVYAHNGGKFDWHLGVLDYIEPFSDVSIINGRLARFKIGDCEFRDSYNILPVPLAQFQKTKVDYGIFKKGERDKPENRKIIEDYLKDDCFDLYIFIRAFIERYGLNLTLAGAAMRQWRKISGLRPPHDNGEIYDKFKKFYYGGRCEVKKQGIFKAPHNKPFKMIDINSAYSKAMMFKHPYSVEYATLYGPEWFDLDDEDKGPAFLEVVCVPNGALPYRKPDSKDRTLFFPDDDKPRTYFITGWELQAALDTGAVNVLDIKTCYSFYELVDFKDYILHFYEQKLHADETNNKAAYIFAKLFMNSLYGKYGSNPFSYRNYKVLEIDCFDNQGKCETDDPDRPFEFGGEFGPYALGAQRLADEEMRFYNLATAASITGFQRAFLWRAISQCVDFMYCDTDSILAADVKNVPNGFGKELGQWSVDGEFSWAALAGRKMYALEYNVPFWDDKKEKWILYKTAHKGAKLTAEQLFKVAQGREIIYHPEAPTFSVHHKPQFIDRRIKMTKKVLQD